MRADMIQLLTSLASFASGLFIPNLAKDLGASNTEIGIITAMSSATAFIASYIFGRLSDIRGPRILIKLGLAICTVVFFLQVFTDPFFVSPLLANPTLLIAVRALAGFSLGIFPAALTVYVFDRKEGLGRFSSFGALGNALGSFIAGLIAFYYGIFILSSACFLVAFLLSLGMKRDTTPRMKIEFLPRKLLRKNWRIYTQFLLRHTGANCIWVIYPLYIISLGGDKFWIGVIYTINLGTQFMVMLLIDRFRETTLISTDLLLSVVTFISFTLAQNYLYLLPMQLLLAASYATLYVGSLTYLIKNNVEKATSGGILSSVISLSTVLGSLIGGVVSQLFGYAATMYIGAILAAAEFVLYLMHSSETTALTQPIWPSKHLTPNSTQKSFQHTRP
jgi:MFS family permease